MILEPPKGIRGNPLLDLRGLDVGEQLIIPIEEGENVNLLRRRLRSRTDRAATGRTCKFSIWQDGSIFVIHRTS